MCTAVTYQTRDFYFGRTLDYDLPCIGEVTVTPRNFPLPFRHGPPIKKHHAIIGMAHIADGYPLYFDAVNEAGLAIAGLNFPGFAHYRTPEPGRDNIASFELIPWLLGQCATVAQARTLLDRLNLTDPPFRPDIPPTPLHWLLADSHEALTIEPVREGLRVYENPVGVLTNSPPFPAQLLRLTDYQHLSPEEPETRFFKDMRLPPYSRGLGALGLPGDLSSGSRFVRAAFVRGNACSGDSEGESVSQFFHILGTVEQVRGCCRTEKGLWELTQYTCCMNASRGIYYCKGYDHPSVTGVDLHRENLETGKLIRFPLPPAESLGLCNSFYRFRDRSGEKP